MGQEPETARCRVRLAAARQLIYGSPKRRHSLGFGVEKILKKSNGVQLARIGVRFAILALFRDPVLEFGRVGNLKEARRIEIGAALIVQNAVIAGLDSNRDIGQTGGKVRIPCILTTELNNHLELFEIIKSQGKQDGFTDCRHDPR